MLCVRERERLRISNSIQINKRLMRPDTVEIQQRRGRLLSTFTGAMPREKKHFGMRCPEFSFLVQ